MKILKWLVILLSVCFLLTGCGVKGDPGSNGTNGTDGEDGAPGVDYIPTDPDGDKPVSISNPTGFAEAGPFLGYSNVTMWPLDKDYMQVGDPYTGDTKADDSGMFTIYAVISSVNVKTKVEGSAYNETSSNIDSNVKMESTIPTSAGVFNANYATSIISIVGNYWFHEDVGGLYYQNQAAFEAAEVTVLNYFDYSGNWEQAVKKSYEMSLTGDTTDDGKLVFINSTIAFEKNGPEQGQFMRQIAEDIYSDANLLKAPVNAITAGLKIKTIKDNLDNYYSSRDLPYDCAPFWNLPGIPAYYELLDRIPEIKEQVNLEYTSVGAFEVGGYNTFAFPVRFTSQIELSKYIAFNFDGENEISIWTRGVNGDGYPVPGIKVLDIDQFNEVLLTDPVQLVYNGSLGTDHGLIAGVDYYVVLRRDTAWQPSKLMEGSVVPFGKNIASNNEGVTWIAHTNTTSWFTRSIKYYTTN